MILLWVVYHALFHAAESLKKSQTSPLLLKIFSSLIFANCMQNNLEVIVKISHQQDNELVSSFLPTRVNLPDCILFLRYSWWHKDINILVVFLLKGIRCISSTKEPSPLERLVEMVSLQPLYVKRLTQEVTVCFFLLKNWMGMQTLQLLLAGVTAYPKGTTSLIEELCAYIVSKLSINSCICWAETYKEEQESPKLQMTSGSAAPFLGFP